jgi:hypothetical protein
MQSLTAAAATVEASASGRWAWPGPRLGWSGSDRAFRLGPNREDFFLNIFPAQKQIRKFQKMLTRHEKYSVNHKNSRKIPRDTLGHEQSK